MELYRVLLVDDEENIREGISRKMDWQGLGFSLEKPPTGGMRWNWRRRSFPMWSLPTSKCRLWMDWSSAAA